MTKKKKTSKKDFSNITHTDLSMTSGGSSELDDLLGAKALIKQDEPAALLRVLPGRLNDDLKKRLSVRLSIEDINQVGIHPIVLGPIAADLLHSLACAGSLGSRDQVLLADNRWRELVDVYPDLKGLILEGDDLTYTATETLTEASTSDKEDSTFTGSYNEAEALELEGVPAPSNQVEARESITSVSHVVAKRPAAASAQKRSAHFNKAAEHTREIDTRIWLLPVAVLLVGLFVWQWPSLKENREEDPAKAGVEFRRRMDEKRIAMLPDNLKPKPVSNLFDGQSVLQRKLRPYMESYERGSLYLNQEAIRVIEGISSPASASFQARVSATNLLAVQAIGKAQYTEARRLLSPILIAAPTDVVSLLNSAILELASGNLPEARRLAVSAQRLCGSPHCWLAYSLLGTIEAQQGRYEQSKLLFDSALASNQNILVYGMWMATFEEAPRNLQVKLDALLKRAIWTDPDRHLDSPLRAPVALHWVYSVASDGWRSASGFTSALSSGQKKYVQWLLGSNPFVPLTESLEAVAKDLAREESSLSQTLYAYVLKELGKFEDASQVLSRSIQLVDYSQTRSSWPWTLAGNVNEEREMIDQAIYYYQNALSRNPRDVNSIYGLAVSMRDKEDYNGALQKIAEVLRLDPSYAPAILRLRRLEWHRKWNYR
ncbi:tetratricopeptide repeat protein [bacterium]|nr:tetratricopeptide repeat protein [bacterium]